MKMLKKLGLALLIATSVGGFSPLALAIDDPGRITYAPDVAIDRVVVQIKAAVEAIKSGSDGAAVAPLIKAAGDASKEINANDKVDRAREKANGLLKKAKAAAKESSLQEAEQLLEQAQKDFEALKSMI
jgi:hypothetical protein